MIYDSLWALMYMYCEHYARYNLRAMYNLVSHVYVRYSVISLPVHEHVRTTLKHMYSVHCSVAESAILVRIRFFERTPCSDNRGTDNRGTDNRGTDNRGTDNRGTDNRGTDNRGTDNRGTDNRGTDNRGTDNRGTDNRGTDNRGTDNRGTDNRGTDNRGTDNGVRITGVRITGIRITGVRITGVGLYMYCVRRPLLLLLSEPGSELEPASQPVMGSDQLVTS